jgi:ABC-type transport system involved in multi-copper enzyme maturation permease subunit
MTSASPPIRATRPGGADTPATSRAAGFGHLLLSEWTKIRSVRSTIWSLVLLVLVTFGFTGLFTWLTILQWTKSDPSQRAQIVADPVSTILGSGLEFGQLTICVLGVLVITSEYSTGVIRASLLAVPRRIPMLAAKAIVFAVLVLIVGEIVTFPSFFLGAAILHSHAPVSLSDPGVARAVFGAGLYLAVLGLFAMGIGGIIRHTAGAITAVIAFVLVLAPLTQLIPGKIGKYVHAYLPTIAGQLIGQAHQQADQVLSPWEGFGVFCAWTAVLLVIAGFLLYRRDA